MAKQKNKNNTNTSTELVNSTPISVPATASAQTFPTRAYEDLSNEEQQIVDSLMENLEDYSDASLIEFSSEVAANSAHEAELFLQNTKLNDLAEFNDCMHSLTRDLRSVDTKTLSKVDPNPLSKIPLIGSALAKSSMGKKVEGIIERQETVKKAIDLTVSTIENIKLTLREDLIRCGKTREKTVEYAKNLEYEYIALARKRQELEDLYSQFISGPEYDPTSLDDSEYIDKIQTGILSIERKMDNVLKYRINAIQDISSLALVRSSENAMISSIDDCIKNVIPEWNKAFLKAILSYRVANAANIMTSTNQATNTIILTSAEMSSNAILLAATAIEEPHLASETLEKKTEIFISTCDQLVQIASAASQRRLDDAHRLKELEAKSIAGNSQRKMVALPSNKKTKSNVKAIPVSPTSAQPLDESTITNNSSDSN